MTNTTSTTTRKAQEIGFGVEIECAIPLNNRNEFPVGSYHRGLPVNRDGLRSWNTQSDCSVHAAGAGYYNAEIVSPVLKGEDGLRQVVMMLDYLAQIGAKIDSSCGLHVHVDCENVSVTRITKLFRAYEMAFYDLNGTHTSARLGSTYCAPSARWTGNRYQSLNLQHVHETHPHIEIRVWQGAMKPETVVAAIYMAVGLVSRASNPDKVTTSDVNRNDPAGTMTKYIERFLTSDTMIVPDEEPDDIYQEMMTAAAHTDRGTAVR